MVTYGTANDRSLPHPASETESRESRFVSRHSAAAKPRSPWDRWRVSELRVCRESAGVVLLLRLSAWGAVDWNLFAFVLARTPVQAFVLFNHTRLQPYVDDGGVHFSPVPVHCPRDGTLQAPRLPSAQACPPNNKAHKEITKGITKETCPHLLFPFRGRHEGGRGVKQRMFVSPVT